MTEFSKAYQEAMKRTHTDEMPAVPATTENTPGEGMPLDALCACLKLPVENWEIVYPLT